MSSILLFAAASKLRSIPEPGELFFDKPHLVFLVASIEFLLATWLIVGGNFEQLWWTTFLVFGIFFFVNVYYLWRGEVSCHCFGDSDFPVPFTLAMDTVVLTLLLMHRHVTCAAVMPQFPSRAAMVLITGSLGFLLALFVADTARNSLWPRSVIPATRVVKIDNGPSEDAAVTEFVLLNQGRLPVTVTGIHDSCKIELAANLPVTIAPGESRPISVAIALPKRNSNQRVRGAVWFYLDSPSQFRVACQYSANTYSSLSKSSRTKVPDSNFP